MQHKDGDYFYPLTTIDQVIMEDGLTRLSGADFVSISTDDAPEGEVVGINADTLGGYAADAYVKKTDAMIVTKNYSVVGGMDEPTIPTENMIWIQTENTIGKVHFSGVEPNNINDNDIWIYTGNSSGVAFDAIKIDNDTMNTVYPISAKQYVSGAWVDNTAKSYQNGEWVEWFTGAWLYNGGSVNEELTGGWRTTKGYDIVFSFTNEGIKAKEANNDSSRDAAAYTNKKVDVTKYNWLIAEKVSVRGHVRDGDASLNYFTIGLTKQNTSNVHTGFVAEERISTEITDAEVKLNISGVSGSYYICLQADVACGTVDKLYLIE